MVKSNKSKAFTFICSFLPGAAEMYLGLMKNGLTLMLAFFISFMLPSALRAGDIFIAFVFVVWFFGFFHARNIAGLSDDAFAALEDKYIWEEFTGSGVCVLWNNISDIVCRYIPEAIWNDIYPILSGIPGAVFAILIIVAGVMLIKGKKESIDEE